MFHCLVINVRCFSLPFDSLFNLSHFSLFVNNFFKFFQTFREVDICHSVSTTGLLYHKFSYLSTVILYFLKIYLFFNFQNTFVFDSQINLSQTNLAVNGFLLFSYNVFFII